MQIGDTVKVRTGATKWLKDRNHWADYITSDIDGMVGEVDTDFRHFSEENARLCVQLGFEHHVGIPEHMLESDADI